MVQANDINVCQDSAQSIDTPAVAGTTNSVPVVNWIAPELPCGAEIVGRDTRDETWPVLFIQQEQFRIGPYIARIGGDKERQIANQAQASGVGVFLEALALAGKSRNCANRA